MICAFTSDLITYFLFFDGCKVQARGTGIFKVGKGGRGTKGEKGGLAGRGVASESGVVDEQRSPKSVWVE